MKLKASRRPQQCRRPRLVVTRFAVVVTTHTQLAMGTGTGTGTSTGTSSKAADTGTSSRATGTGTNSRATGPHATRSERLQYGLHKRRGELWTTLQQLAGLLHHAGRKPDKHTLQQVANALATEPRERGHTQVSNRPLSSAAGGRARFRSADGERRATGCSHNGDRVSVTAAEICQDAGDDFERGCHLATVTGLDRDGSHVDRLVDDDEEPRLQRLASHNNLGRPSRKLLLAQHRQTLVEAVLTAECAEQLLVQQVRR